MTYEKTAQARREGNRKAAKYDAIMAKANENPEPTPVEKQLAPADESGYTNNSLSITRWLFVVSIVVSLSVIYCKREELIRQKKRHLRPLNQRLRPSNLSPRIHNLAPRKV